MCSSGLQVFYIGTSLVYAVMSTLKGGHKRVPTGSGVVYSGGRAVFIRYLVCWLYACSVWCVCIVFGLCLRVGMVLIRCVSSVYVGVIKFKLAFRLV